MKILYFVLGVVVAIAGSAIAQSQPQPDTNKLAIAIEKLQLDVRGLQADFDGIHSPGELEEIVQQLNERIYDIESLSMDNISEVKDRVLKLEALPQWTSCLIRVQGNNNVSCGLTR